MRAFLPALAALLFVSCSCERKPDSLEPPPPADTGRQATQAAHPLSEQDPVDGALVAQAEMVRDAVSGVHAYIRAAAGKDWEAADAFWVGGKAPTRPGDQVLRQLEGLQAMRIINQPPVHLDEQSPPDALEIPVVLRINDSGGSREITGWYRTRRDGEGWKITSASLAPALD
jgi:hypothetical protein